MAQQDDPYGLMAALTPQAAPTAYAAPYIPPAAATLGAGLSALGTQQTALQKQLATEAEQREKEREARLQKQGEQLYEIGQASYQPELMARGAALRAGGLLPVEADQFLPAARLTAIEKGAKVIGEAAGVAKYMTPESAQQYTQRVAEAVPGLGGLQFDFLSGGTQDSTMSVGRMNLAQTKRNQLDDNLQSKEERLETDLKTPGVYPIGSTERNEAEAARARIAAARARIYFLSDEDLEPLYAEIMKKPLTSTTGVRTAVTKAPGIYEEVKGDRKFTIEYLPGGSQRILGSTNLAPTEVQAFRIEQGKLATERATKNLRSLLAARDFSRENTLVERLRRDRNEGRLAKNQERRLEIAEAILDLQQEGSERAGLDLSLKIAQYFNPSVDPGKLTADAYAEARKIIVARSRDERGRPLATLEKSRSQADRERAEEIINEQLDDVAGEYMRRVLDAQTRFWQANPVLLTNLFRNLEAAPGTERPESPRTPAGTGPAPAGAPAGTVPAPPALPPDVRLPSLPPAAAAPGASLPRLPGAGAGAPVPPPPPLTPGAGAGSPRVKSAKEPSDLRGAVNGPRTVRIRRANQKTGD